MTRILYLHGFASGPTSSKARYFRSLLEHAGFRVDVPDLADGSFERLTITGQLSVIERETRGDSVALIGSSMGGYLAALHAARHPEVKRAVLLAPAFGFARRWAERLGPGGVEEWRRRGCIEVFHYAEGGPRNLGVELLDDAAQYEDYPDLQQPCLIFHGASDDVVPVQYSREFAAGRPNVRLQILNSGHELLDVLEAMGEQVEGFLRDG
jgi:pimeloyl-ACP methyl ester carboxylesterase